MSRLDIIYRKFLLTKIFTKGWGSPENLRRLFKFQDMVGNRETCQTMVSPNHPVHIDKDEYSKDYHIIEGHFESPFNQHLPELMASEVKTAQFQAILPREWKTHLRPVILHLAGTGDHYFWRRRAFLAKPLIKEYGIGSVILENPFYGRRKPKKQIRSSLHNVTDLFVMGGALILESMVLLRWCEQQGFGPLGLSGISMGGHMASLAATNWYKPISLVPCLSGSTASSVFTQGVLSEAIPWKVLEKQIYADNNYEEDFSRLVHFRDDKNSRAFQDGVDFARQFEDGLQSVVAEDERSATFNQALIQIKQLTNLSTASDIITSEWHKKVHKDSLNFMCGVMDKFTHLGNYSVPIDPSLVIIIMADRDAYVPPDRVVHLCELWQGAEIRRINCGHIAAFLKHHHKFRKAIKDSLDKQVKKYYKQNIISNVGVQSCDISQPTNV